MCQNGIKLTQAVSQKSRWASICHVRSQTEYCILDWCICSTLKVLASTNSFPQKKNKPPPRPQWSLFCEWLELCHPDPQAAELQQNPVTIISQGFYSFWKRTLNNGIMVGFVWQHCHGLWLCDSSVSDNMEWNNCWHNLGEPQGPLQAPTN